MRNCFLKIQSHVSKLSVLGVTDIPKTSTKHIKDFCEHQNAQTDKFQVGKKES